MEIEKKQYCRFADTESQRRISIRCSKELLSKFNYVVRTTCRSKSDYIRSWIESEFSKMAK